MGRAARVTTLLYPLLILVAASSARGEGDRRPPKAGVAFGAATSGYGWFGPPFFMTIGPGGVPVTWYPVPIGFSNLPVVRPIPAPQHSTFTPAAKLPQPRVALDPSSTTRRIASERRAEALLVGDRLFRVGNLKRAEQRYLQAQHIDPGSATPRVRLSQVALLRGHYSEVAEKLREACAAEPGWVGQAMNIRTLYGEPRDFDSTVSSLESHLLLEPDDRDAWFVLGAQLFLSGQSARAADVFERLTNEKPDEALKSFLGSTRILSIGRAVDD